MHIFKSDKLPLHLLAHELLFMYISGLEYLASELVCILGTRHPNEIFHPVFRTALHSCPVGTKRKKGPGYKSLMIAPLGSPPSYHPPFSRQDTLF
jgi:hypothetical protein